MNKTQTFLRLVEPQREALSAYCRRLLWAPTGFEDALQDTLATAFREFDERASWSRAEFRAWIFRIATWTCFDANRRQRRTRTEVLPEETQAGAVDLLEREFAYEEILANPAAACEGFGDELARACRGLSEKERSIFLLKALGGLTCAEIAGVLDVPLGTAQGLLTRARGKLRARLVNFVRDRSMDNARES